MSKIEKTLVLKKIRIIILVFLMISMILVLISIVSSYLKKFEAALISENTNYLSEIADHIIVNMQTVVEDTKKALETSSLTLSTIPDSANQKIYLDRIKENYDLDYVGYASRDGNMICTLESEIKNISYEAYFKKSLSGESSVIYEPRKLYQDGAAAGLLISTPVYNLTDNSQEPIGVLISFFNMKNLNKVLSVESFGGAGYTYIIDMQGDIILHTKGTEYSNLYTALGNTEFQKDYSVDKVVADISSQMEGFSNYNHFGVEKYMYYKYLGIDSWSVVNVVDKNVITDKTTILIKQLTAIGIAIVIIFPILLVFAVLSFGFSNSQRQATAAKSAFLANMSHEIRTPMNAIVGISEILLRENVNAKQKNLVLSIINAGNGLLTIINDILDISKIESGKFRIIEEEYELESLIYDIITIATIRIGDKPIDFMVDLDPDIPKYVTGDMIRMKQVLLNIIGNAIKFTDKGYIKLGIYVKKTDSGLLLTMPIEDTGKGIQKKDINQLFVSFNQVDAHKNYNVEGTGLGLVISKRLCEMMGGTITVDSEYGHGSTFTITVKQKITRPEKMLHISKTHNFRLLLFEKSDILRTYFTSCMKKMKLEFTSCTDSQTFMTEIKAGGYTHTLANAQITQSLANSNDVNSEIKFITLLSFQEQSMKDNHSLTIATPLFTMQLAATLYNRDPYHVPLVKRSGIDIFTIQPMPFVKILLVDDNEVNLQVANGLMQPYYMQVDCALSGKSAIDIIKKNAYDLVFMDHMMPEMSGVEAVQIIRSLPDKQKQAIPIVALTANITQDARELFMETGFDDFLAKPIETVKLNAILKKWLKSKNDKRALENPEKAAAYQNTILKDSESSKNIKQTVIPRSSAYVDFEEGISKIGSKEAYCNILETYYRTSKEKLIELPKLLDTNPSIFTIEIHGLKGASASIAAPLIARKAAELEALAKENATCQISSLLPEFLQDLEHTLDEIHLFTDKYKGQQLLTVEAPEKELKTGSLPADFISNIKEAFLDFDTEMIKLLLDTQESFTHEQPETKLLQSLHNYYNSYDFESPIALLDNYELTISKENEDAI